jgi:Rrf2 family protein
MISQTAEYALRAVVKLARETGSTMTTHEIADATRVPPGYLSKVLQALGRARLVVSQRGLHGGFALSRAPSQISVLEVINAVDPIQRIYSCPLGIPAHKKRLCALHRRLDEALESVEEALARSTIDELLSDMSGCHVFE